MKLPFTPHSERLNTMCQAISQWVKAVADTLTATGHGSRNRRRGRAPLELEQFDKRVVPAATNWTNGGGDWLWSNANNWSAGLPDATKVAVLQPVGATQGTIIYDNTVQDINRVVAGLKTNGWMGTLSLTGGKSLTVSSLASDITTGFHWSTQASISQATASDVLIITGGGTADNNTWSGGTIGSTATQGEVDIDGGTTLRITGSALALGDNLVIGADFSGGSTVEFYNQAQTLTVNNNAYIQVADNTNDLAPNNQIQFDTDVTQGGNVTKGLDTASPDSFIDNHGTITRSNAGTYQINLPIKNEPALNGGTSLLDVKTRLWVSGSSLNKTANVSVDQVDGKILLEDLSQLRTAKGVLMAGGRLETDGGNIAYILIDDLTVTTLSVTGGTIDVSAANHAQYGSLSVQGNMSWTGGTFTSYVNGATAGQQTNLLVGLTLTLGGNAHLQVNSIGPLTSGLLWVPVSAGTAITNTLTFDSAALFNIAYLPTHINVTSR